MVSSVASLKHLSAGPWPVASVRSQATSHPLTTKTEQAPISRGATVCARRVEGRAELARAAMAALLHVQERHAAAEVRDGAREALGDVLSRLQDGHEHKKPKKPKPHDPPPPPAPPPALPPLDDPEPARYLESVLAQIHERPQSQFSDVPFSQRNSKPAAPPPASSGLDAFYTPGMFTPAQATAMRTMAQAQAGLALLQSSQASLYGLGAQGAEPFRIDTFA